MPIFDFFYRNDQSGETLAGEGPIIPVEISMPAALEQHCANHGLLIPSAIIGYALIDTGASITAVDETVLEKLNIRSIDEIDCSSPHGTERNSIYPLKLSFPALNLKDLPMARVLGCKLK